MIKINLLSPLDKENLRWEKVNKLTVRSIACILFAELIFVGIFFVTLEYLKAEEQAVASEYASVINLPQTREIIALEKEAKENRSKINSIYTIKEGHTDWTSLFDSIATITPAGVRLESITVSDATPKTKTTSPQPQEGVEIQQTEGKMKVEVAGNAKTRDMLLEFENNLKGEKRFTDLEYDAANYVKSVNIDFKYSFNISEEELLK